MLTLHQPQEVKPIRPILPPTHRPKPFLQLDLPEDLVLLSACIAYVLEEEVEEGGDDHRFIAVPDGLVIERLARRGGSV